MNCVKCGSALPDGALFCPACGKRQSKQSRRAIKRPNGSGTVYKLQGRRSRPWVAAKSRVIIGYYQTRKDALEALERLAGKDLTERYNMTFREVFEAWKEEHYKEIGPRGVESYNRAFDVFQPLHDARFRSLRTADFQAVMDKYADKSHSTCSKYKQLVTQMSAWAIREEIATTNFAKFIHLPENVKKEKEIFSDYHETYVIGGEKTAAGRNRAIPIRPEGRAYFAYFAARAKGTLLLSGYTGQQVPANFRRRDYYPLLEQLKIERKTPHATRHTYASWARRSGMATDILQKILGHADYSTTANIYVHADISELIAAVDTADEK